MIATPRLSISTFFRCQSVESIEGPSLQAGSMTIRRVCRGRSEPFRQLPSDMHMKDGCWGHLNDLRLGKPACEIAAELSDCLNKADPLVNLSPSSSCCRDPAWDLMSPPLLCRREPYV